MKYYFLVSYLPEISRYDIKIRFTLSDLLEERFHLPVADWKEIELVLLGRDILIIEKLLSGKRISLEHSLFTPEFWRDEIKSPKECPDFLQEYLISVDPSSFGPKDVDRLYSAYFEYVLATTRNDFLKGYFSFHMDLRNIAAALRARRNRLDPSEHVIGEGDLVEILGISTAEDFGLSGQYPWLENLLKADAPHLRQEAMEHILWDYLDEKSGPDVFGFNVILTFLLKLQFLHERLALSKEKGMEKVRRLGGF